MRVWRHSSGFGVSSSGSFSWRRPAIPQKRQWKWKGMEVEAVFCTHTVIQSFTPQSLFCSHCSSLYLSSKTGCKRNPTITVVAFVLQNILFSSGDSSEFFAFPRVFLLPRAIFCPYLWSGSLLDSDYLSHWTESFLESSQERILFASSSTQCWSCYCSLSYITILSALAFLPSQGFLKPSQGRATEHSESSSITIGTWQQSAPRMELCLSARLKQCLPTTSGHQGSMALCCYSIKFPTAAY